MIHHFLPRFDGLKSSTRRNKLMWCSKNDSRVKQHASTSSILFIIATRYHMVLPGTWFYQLLYRSTWYQYFITTTGSLLSIFELLGALQQYLLLVMVLQVVVLRTTTTTTTTGWSTTTTKVTAATLLLVVLVPCSECLRDLLEQRVFQQLEHSTRYLVPDTGISRSSLAWYQVPGTRCLVPGTRLIVLPW